MAALCQRRDDITQMRTQEKCRLEAPENDHIKESCQKTIEFFDSQINELNDTIQKIIDESRELQQRQKILKTVPGIGKKLSQDFLCLMPELGYLNRKEVASLAGVAPHPKESGKAVGYRRITGGRSNVRSKLFTAAMAATRSKSILGAFYSKLVESGKKKMVAITALMHKISDQSRHRYCILQLWLFCCLYSTLRAIFSFAHSHDIFCQCYQLCFLKIFLFV